jgi:hypothetical protein
MAGIGGQRSVIFMRPFYMFLLFRDSVVGESLEGQGGTTSAEGEGELMGWHPVLFP